jgi:heme-degrading monooxygenase HmoA
MIVVANRIPVAKGYEEEFEKRFKGRAGLVDGMHGFIKNYVLRPIDSDYYVVQTYWESWEAFKAWTESEAFKKAHSSRPPKEMFSGKNVFEMHEVIDFSESKDD